jgi:hypothetical protein
MSATSLHEASLQTSANDEQSRALPAPQTPSEHVCPTVQYKSPQAAPLALASGLGSHWSVVALHTPTLQASFAEEQSGGPVLPVQFPSMQ